MASRRRYPQKTKLATVIASDATTTLAVSKATGIPRSTIIEWRNKPEFDSFRQNAREGMAEDAALVARLAWRKLGDAIIAGELEGRDLVAAAGMATEKSQLLSGKPTERTEQVSATDGFDDHEKRTLAGILRGELARRTGRPAPDGAEGTAVVGAPEGEAGTPAG